MKSRFGFDSNSKIIYVIDFLGGELQPCDAHQVHRGDPLRQDQPQQGDPQG